MSHEIKLLLKKIKVYLMYRKEKLKCHRNLQTFQQIFFQIYAIENCLNSTGLICQEE